MHEFASLAVSASLPAAPPAPALVVPALLLAALGLAAFFLARRRSRPARIVQIVETASLGPKRSLVVARVGDETLILGASEAGISLLGTRAGTVAIPSSLAPKSVSPRTKRSTSAILGRIRPMKSGGAPEFEPLLRESIEDAELRAKVAAGLRGSVA